MGKFGTNASKEGTSCVSDVRKKASAKLKQKVVKYELRKSRILWLLNDLATVQFRRRGWGYVQLENIDSLSIVSETDPLLK